MARAAISDEEMLCTASNGEICTTDHEPKFGRCNYCSKIKACAANADLMCNAQPTSLGMGMPPCRGAILLFPYIQQPDLQAAYRLGGIDAVEEIIRPRFW